MLFSVLLFAGAALAATPPPPELGIVNAGSDGLSLTRSVSRFQHTFIIESTNKTDVSKLQILVPDFVGPDGIIAETTVALDGRPLGPGTRVDIPGVGDVRLTVSATLIQSGDYMTSIALIYGDKRQTTSIKVSRNRDALDLTLENSGAAVGSARLGSPATVSFWVTAVVGGRTVTLEEPTIRKLTRRSGNVDGRADYAGLQFALIDKSKPDWPLTLDPSAAMSIKVSIDGLTSAGTYQGKLIFPSHDRTPAENSFSFSIRRSWIEAAAIIAFGLLVSLGLRYLQENIRPRLRQQVDALNLLLRLRRSVLREARLRREDEELITSLTERLSQLYAELRVTSIDGADDIIDEIAAKLPLLSTWINTNADIHDLPADTQKDLHDELMEIGHVIAAEGSSADEIEAAKTQLEALRGKVVTAFMAAQVESVASLPMEKIQLEKLSVLAKAKRSEIVFDLAILGIAIVLGLYLLWSPSATWGQPADMFVAFLWGLGLHTITANQKFEGLGDLAGRFGKP